MRRRILNMKGKYGNIRPCVAQWTELCLRKRSEVSHNWKNNQKQQFVCATSPQVLNERIRAIVWEWKACGSSTVVGWIRCWAWYSKRLKLINGVLDLSLVVQLYLDSLMNWGPWAVLTFFLNRSDSSRWRTSSSVNCRFVRPSGERTYWNINEPTVNLALCNYSKWGEWRLFTFTFVMTMDKQIWTFSTFPPRLFRIQNLL